MADPPSARDDATESSPSQQTAFQVFTPRTDVQQRMRQGHEADAAAAAQAEEIARSRRMPQYDTPVATPLGGHAITGDLVNAHRARLFNRRTAPTNPAIRRMAQEQMAKQAGQELGGEASSSAEAAEARMAEAHAVQAAVARIGSPELRDIFHTLARNVIQSPHDASKRQLKENNPRLRTTVFADGATRVALQLLGWQRDQQREVWHLPLLENAEHAAQLRRLSAAADLGAGKFSRKRPQEARTNASSPALNAWLAAHGFTAYGLHLLELGVRDTADLTYVSDEMLTSLRMPPAERLRFFVAAQEPNVQPVGRSGAGSSSAHARANDEPNTDLICPITQALMVDPVINMAGHTYERDAIEGWFAQCIGTDGQLKDPLSNTTLQDATLVPNHVIKRQVHEYSERHATAVPSLPLRARPPVPPPAPPPTAPLAPPPTPPTAPPAPPSASPTAQPSPHDLDETMDEMLAAAIAASLGRTDVAHVAPYAPPTNPGHEDASLAAAMAASLESMDVGPAPAVQPAPRIDADEEAMVAAAIAASLESMDIQ
jgi:hypothetical protein